MGGIKDVSEHGAELLQQGKANAYFREILQAATQKELGLENAERPIDLSNEPLNDVESRRLAEVMTAMIVENQQLVDQHGRMVDPIREMPIPPVEKSVAQALIDGGIDLIPGGKDELKSDWERTLVDMLPTAFVLRDATTHRVVGMLDSKSLAPPLIDKSDVTRASNSLPPADGVR